MDRRLVLVCIATMLSAWWINSYPGKHPFTVEERVGDEYDYIIVGGGSAGSVLAARLSEDKDSRVLLLEAGGSYAESQTVQVPAFWSLLLSSEKAWQHYTTEMKYSHRGMNDKRAHAPHGRVLGGSSAINAMQYTRGSRFDFDDWAAGGCAGWSYEEVLPYFLKSEDIQIPELQSSRYHSSGGPLTVSSGRVTPLAELYLKAGEEMGYNITDYNGALQEGFSYTQLTVRDGVRASAGLAFLSNVKGRPNLDISVESLVTKIDNVDGTAVGVFFIKNGRKQYVRAREEIIISAGAINSPQLLMLSGIGPKEHLQEIGIPVKVDLPVGQNLQDQPFLLLFSEIKEPMGINADVFESLWTSLQYKMFGTGPMSVSGGEAVAHIHLDESMNGKTHPDIQLLLASLLIASNFQNVNSQIAKEYYPETFKRHGITSAVAVTRPKSKGTITLRSEDPFDDPVIDLQYLAEKEDVVKLISGIRKWERFMQTDTMKDIGVDIDKMRMSFCGEHRFRSDEYWECYVRHVASTYYHHCGTCKMGADDDPSAVVDPELRVRGIKRLRVVDASVFPIITSGNTNAPTIMVAEKAADLIRGKKTV